MTSPDSPVTPPIPPVPAYGEYASPEHAEAARQAQLAAQQPGYAQLGYAQPGYAQPGYAQQPPAQQPYTSQPYAQQPYSAQPYGQQPQNPAGPRPLRTGDMIASIVLLVVGFFSTLIAILNALTLTTQIQALYEENGLTGAYEPTVGATVAVIVIIASHLILLAIAAIVTALLIRKRKPSFWVPLVAGVLAFVIFFGAIIAVMLSDPALVDAITQQSL